MDVIEEFIARYTREYDYYSRASRLAAQILENSLRSTGIRCLVTSRAKDAGRLEEKCRKRDRRSPYSSVDDIARDIVDLAGVRVALYFPAERDQVDKIISRLFVLLEPRKDFPEGSQGRGKKRFSGYSASHYRVQLRETDLSEPDRRYADARVEIQVASVLMHAWSEVEHDLVYKPSEGELSDDEHALLDQLNGLVHAGEIALEGLQRAGESRVAQLNRAFLNHYELAVHLLSRVGALSSGPVDDEGLGRVDYLFSMLVELKLATPGLLEQYLDALHGNLEVRPLAEQIIDALLAEDPSRYETYQKVRTHGPGDGRGRDGQDPERSVGAFLNIWNKLEKVLRAHAVAAGETRPVSLGRSLERLNLIDPSLRGEFEALRYLRNRVVHGDDNFTPADLERAAQWIEALAARIEPPDPPDASAG